MDGTHPHASDKLHGHIAKIGEVCDSTIDMKVTWRLALIASNSNDPSTCFDDYDNSEISSISCLDNIAFDSSGSLWIATDGNLLSNADTFLRQGMWTRVAVTRCRTTSNCGFVDRRDTTVLCSVEHPGEVNGAIPDTGSCQLFPYDAYISASLYRNSDLRQQTNQESIDFGCTRTAKPWRA